MASFHLLFRIFYSGFYGVLIICLIGLLLITPGDAIRQALDNNQLYNVFVVAGCYLLTGVFAVIIYASRLYTTKTTLAAIPKTWVPVEKGDVGKSVRRMIVESLTRSAVIAWDARPRIPPDVPNAQVKEGEKQEEEIADGEKYSKHHLFRRKSQATREDFEKGVALPEHHPVWGIISHNGWASPVSPDLSNLEYTNVILELPHLIEAKAVSLAPADTTSDMESPLPDPFAVELLQRPLASDLRDYITQLTGLGVLPPEEVVSSFVTAYEHARFAARPLDEAEFRHLMGIFAEILRMMSSLEPGSIGDVESEAQSWLEEDASESTTPDTRRSRSIISSRSARSGSQGTMRTTRSRQWLDQDMARRSSNNESSVPKGKMRTMTLDRPRSIGSVYIIRGGRGLRKALTHSLRSNSSASVIRLKHSVSKDELPYTIHVKA